MDCLKHYFANKNSPTRKFPCAMCHAIIPANHKLALCYKCYDPATFVHKKDCFEKLMKKLNGFTDNDEKGINLHNAPRNTDNRTQNNNKNKNKATNSPKNSKHDKVHLNSPNTKS